MIQITNYQKGKRGHQYRSHGHQRIIEEYYEKLYVPNFAQPKEPFSLSAICRNLHTHKRKKKTWIYIFSKQETRKKTVLGKKTITNNFLMNMDVKSSTIIWICIIVIFIALTIIILHCNCLSISSPLDFQPPQGHRELFYTQPRAAGTQWVFNTFYVKLNLSDPNLFRLGAVLDVFKICLRGSLVNCTSVR